MVEASLPLSGPNGPLTLLEAFEGRRQVTGFPPRSAEHGDRQQRGTAVDAEAQASR